MSPSPFSPLDVNQRIINCPKLIYNYEFQKSSQNVRFQQQRMHLFPFFLALTLIVDVFLRPNGRRSA